MGGNHIRTKTVFLAGHAALPQGMAAKGPYEHLAVVVEIDSKYGVIINAECTLITDLAINFLHDCLVGCCMEDGVDAIISEIINTYHGAAKNAIIASLKDLNRAYIKYKGM
ncbi:MAG: ornithine cyclodeaminase [Clostridiaceae bacterium BRH_c20a]|nr:MAG: ornithine cyclodeaminase [Clostridiaceae bacterium BRH_c20a]